MKSLGNVGEMGGGRSTVARMGEVVATRVREVDWQGWAIALLGCEDSVDAAVPQ